MSLPPPPPPSPTSTPYLPPSPDLDERLELTRASGWNAPKHSYLLVHPDGEASRATNEEINISFDPSPDYAGIAKAAAGGELHAARAGAAAELEGVLAEAIKAVEGGVSAVVDVGVVKGC